MTKNKSGNLTLSFAARDRLMTKPKPPAKGLTIDDAKPAKMTAICGGSSDDYNQVQAAAVVNALPYAPNWDDKQKDAIRLAAVSAMRDMKPRDVIDGMLAGMIVATNSAGLDCLRRAQIDVQTFAGRQMNLSMANKLIGTCARLVEVLDRRRGNGSTQTVRVEHVTVEAGANAIIGAVEAGGRGGAGYGIEGQPHKPAICAAAAPVLPAMRGQDAARDPVSVAGNAKRKVPTTRRTKPRRA